MPTPTGTRNDPFSRFPFLVDIQRVGERAVSRGKRARHRH
jgi:hypothetical protein